MRSYVEEYDRQYSQPYIGCKVTGFSGIDPSISDEELEKIILRVICGSVIQIDSGEIR